MPRPMDLCYIANPGALSSALARLGTTAQALKFNRSLDSTSNLYIETRANACMYSTQTMYHHAALILVLTCPWDDATWRGVLPALF